MRVPQLLLLLIVQGSRGMVDTKPGDGALFGIGVVGRGEAPHNSSVGPIGAHEWRNDSANIRLVKAWNDLLALSPLSREFPGAVSDTPPVALDWTVGADMPIGCTAIISTRH